MEMGFVYPHLESLYILLRRYFNAIDEDYKKRRPRYDPRLKIGSFFCNVTKNRD
jgi:hypothetical protein